MPSFCALIVAASVFISDYVWGADGLVSLKSPHRVQATMDRLEKIVDEKGMTIFARIDHAEGARKIGQKLRPTELLIFGRPQGGTPFMQCQQTVGIDLPLKALAWEDASGQVWLGYNDPAFVARRHGAGECPVVEKLGKAIQGFAQRAVAR